MPLLVALVLVAQTAIAPVQAYTTFDPDPNGIGLALPTGRYTLQLDGCAIEPLENVTAWTDEAGMPVMVGSCPVVAAEQIADVPCFTNDLGYCDFAAEHN